MIQSEQDYGLYLNQRGEMGNTDTAISTVDGRFFFVTDDTQATEWALYEIKDDERSDIYASEVQDYAFGSGDDWWFLTINHGSYKTLGKAYAAALRIMDGEVA